MMINIPLFILTVGALNCGYAYPLVFLFLYMLRPKLRGRQICFNFLYSPGFWLLICTGVLYVAIGMRSITAVYHHIVLLVLAYAIGWGAAEDESDENIRDGIYSLIAGFSVYALLNYSVNIGNIRYSLVDFWTGSARAATGSGTLNTMMVSIITYIFFVETRRRVRLGYYILFVFTILYMFMLGTRTQFLILIIMLLFGSSLQLYRKHGVNGVLGLLTVLLVVTAVGLFVFNHNFFSIRDLISDTNLAQRFSNQSSIESSDSFRIQGLWTGLKELFIYPLGGRSDQAYHHNMWLDVGRVAGIIPFSTLFIYSVLNLRCILLTYKRHPESQELSILLLLLNMGINLNFLVEPIWEGAWSFFLSACVLDGMIGALMRRNYSEFNARENASFTSGIC